MAACHSGAECSVNKGVSGSDLGRIAVEQPIYAMLAFVVLLLIWPKER